MLFKNLERLSKKLQSDPALLKYSSVQSMAEVGLGSLVHSLHLPAGGHLLSINQVICLCLATRRETNRMSVIRGVVGVSGLVALMKLFSPYGKRLTPMMAIFVQGLLLALGVGVAGANLLGIALGASLMSVWGFVQPLITAYVFFGSTFFNSIEKMWTDLSMQLNFDPSIGVTLIWALLVLKVILAVGAAVLSWTANDNFESRYLESVNYLWLKSQFSRKRSQSEQSFKAAHRSIIWQALLDLLNPLFLLSFILCLLFAQENTIAFALRTFVVSYAIFLLVRFINYQLERNS